MSSQVRESPRMRRTRREVMVAVNDVLGHYGMPPAHRVDIEERHLALRVCISCHRRVPQYVRERLQAAVADRLSLFGLAPDRILVAVVLERRHREFGGSDHDDPH